MEMISKTITIQDILKNRDRFKIPEWQRDKVWDTSRQQLLIDTILRNWKLPKFYFAINSEDPEDLIVVDGQQRLSTILDFVDGQFSLSRATDHYWVEFSRPFYEHLPSALLQKFAAFQIEYDEITKMEPGELQEYFLRLQHGVPLSATEKMNAIQSEFSSYCKQITQHPFFQTSVSFPNTRKQFFKVATLITAIEVAGLAVDLSAPKLKRFLEHSDGFSRSGDEALRINGALDFLAKAFPETSLLLEQQPFVQSLVTLAARLVETGKSPGLEAEFANFVEKFMEQYTQALASGSITLSKPS